MLIVAVIALIAAGWYFRDSKTLVSAATSAQAFVKDVLPDGGKATAKADAEKAAKAASAAAAKPAPAAVEAKASAPGEAVVSNGGVVVASADGGATDEAAAKKARLDELKRKAAETAKKRKDGGA